MNRLKIGLVALAAVALSGCGAGQLAQTTSQEPAINGNSVNVNKVAVRDIRIQAVQTGDAIQPGHNVDLVAVAVNQSPDTPDRLVGITSDIGTVTLSGDGRLPAARRTASRSPRAPPTPTTQSGPPSTWRRPSATD